MTDIETLTKEVEADFVQKHKDLMTRAHRYAPADTSLVQKYYDANSQSINDQFIARYGQKVFDALMMLLVAKGGGVK